MRENLLVLAQTFATANGWSLATVAKIIHGNQAFLARYLAGKVAPTTKTYHLMVNRLRATWPAGTPWPITSPIGPLSQDLDPDYLAEEARLTAKKTERSQGRKKKLGKKVARKTRRA